MKGFVAVDLGASNGRTILGWFDGQKITLQELNRFENNYTRVGDAYYWDVLHLYSCIKEGLRNCAKISKEALSGIGIDTWGVDFGLIDKQGRLVGNPRAYRDPRGARGMNAFSTKYGETKANLRNSIQKDTGLKNAPPIFCVGSHDTASAVASVPATTENYAFISSGTWSLIGAIRDTALINNTVYENKFSNEGTIAGNTRLLQNIMGLWIIQNCKRQWDREEKVSWDDIVGMAKAVPGFRSFIDVNAHVFFDGDNMVEKIQQYCEDTDQPIPQSIGEIARTVYESLAMSYKEAFVGLEQLKGGRIDVLHIVGGGARNSLLNQFAANAIDREVIAGPTKATAIGNLMVQVKASGEVKDTDEMRQVIRNSFDVESYEP